jgi:methyl-accepting chemotaxis protein
MIHWHENTPPDTCQKTAGQEGRAEVQHTEKKPLRQKIHTTQEEIMSDQDATIEECRREIAALKEELGASKILAEGMDLIPLPFHIIDRNYRILYINRAAADLLGMKAADCIGKPCKDLYKTKLCGSKNCPCRVAMDSGRTNNINNELAGGRWINCTGIPFTDGAGRIAGAVEYFPDTTAQVMTVRDLLRVGEEARRGNLSARASLEAEGDFLEIAKSVNGILDTVIVPLQLASTHVEQISRGITPEKVREDYEGDLGTLVKNLNLCVDSLGALEECDAVLKRIAVNDYTTRVEGNYEGGYGEIAAAVNDVRNRLIIVQGIAANISRGDLSDLAELKKIGKRSENDELRPALIAMEEGLLALVEDANMLAKAGREGRLSVRADISRHRGSFAEVVDGVNNLLDAVVGPLDEGMKVAGALAQGDYTRTFSNEVQVAGEFRKFKDALNEIMVNGREAFRQAIVAAEKVEYGTLEASKGGDQIAQATEQVALTSQRCADLGKKTLTGMEEISRRISDLSASNEEIASTSQEVLERAESLAQTGRDAQKLGKEANAKIAIVEKIATESATDITQLNEEMRQINKIVKLITDISNQTNLLALNAAIEAARAGEHGRGFAVVAGEVRNLAGESKKATNDIENLITTIQQKSEKTARAIMSANSEITGSVESVDRAIKALNQIVEGAGMVTHDVSEIARAIEDQANTSNAVVQIVDDGTKLTRSNLDQIEDLAALAEETSASTEEIGSATHELNELASELRKQMGRFKI